MWNNLTLKDLFNKTLYGNTKTLANEYKDEYDFNVPPNTNVKDYKTGFYNHMDNSMEKDRKLAKPSVSALYNSIGEETSDSLKVYNNYSFLLNQNKKNN